METVNLLRSLQKEAPATDGKVVRLCGNHELMLLQSFLHYANFRNPEVLASELKKEIAKGDVCASFTDGERLFTHAGLKSVVRDRILKELKVKKHEITGKEVNLYLLCNHINEAFRKSVQNDFYEDHPIFWIGRERRGYDPAGGIFWCDFTSMKAVEEAGTCPQIFGHTPTGKNEIGTAHNLKVINVDTGMCRAYGGQIAYLEIIADSLVQHSKCSSSKWSETLLMEGTTASPISMELNPCRRKNRLKNPGL